VFTVEIQADCGPYWQPVQPAVVVDAPSAEAAALLTLEHGLAERLVLGQPWQVMAWSDPDAATGHLWWKHGPNYGTEPDVVVASETITVETDHGLVDTGMPHGQAGGRRCHRRRQFQPTLYVVTKACGEGEPGYPYSRDWQYVRDLANPELSSEEEAYLNATDPNGAPGYGFFSYLGESRN